jgi:non-heme chloroperoxidase
VRLSEDRPKSMSVITICRKWLLEQNKFMNVSRFFTAATAGLIAYVIVGASALAGQQPDVAPSSQGADRDRQSPTWRDTSPHKSGFVQANGVKLHYLDWGGQGETLLFLAGLGHNAHIFDDLAPEFTDRFHVLAMTRRGFGKSDCPAAGYDVATRVADLLGFLDALRIKQVILAGHSIAGDELTAFAAAHPERVEKLIYFDGDVDPVTDPRAQEIREGNEPEAPQIPKQALVSWDALFRFLYSMLSITPPSRALEASMRDAFLVHPDGSLERRTPANVYREIMKGYAFASLDYTKIKQPTLSFYSDPSTAPDPQRQKEVAAMMSSFIARIKKSGPQIRIDRIAGSGHYMFIDHQDEVARKMKFFLKLSRIGPSRVKPEVKQAIALLETA